MALMSEAETGKKLRITVEGPDFDTGNVRPVTIVVPAITGDANGALTAQGLTFVEEGEALLLEEPFGGPFGNLSTDYDFYGDSPVKLVKAEVENERMPKELFFIPALLLLAGLVLIQRPRATQPAF